MRLTAHTGICRYVMPSAASRSGSHCAEPRCGLAESRPLGFRVALLSVGIPESARRGPEGLVPLGSSPRGFGDRSPGLAAVAPGRPGHRGLRGFDPPGASAAVVPGAIPVAADSALPAEPLGRWPGLNGIC